MIGVSAWAVNAWAAQAAGCGGAPTCPDDSGPNLLVRGVEFLLALVLLAGVVWTVRHVRRWRRRG